MNVFSDIFKLNNKNDIPDGTANLDKKDTTSLERLVNIFKVDEFDNISPELNIISQVSCLSIFTGIIYGGFMETRHTYTDFVRNNQATIYKDHLEAKRLLQNKITTSFGRGAFKWAWRLCIFSTTYVGVSTCMATYRGKYSIFDHMAGGSAAGFLYKFSMGPRGAVVGAGLGLVLGAVAGGATMGLLSLANMSMEDVKKIQYKIHDYRKDSEKDMMRKYMKREQIEILTKHNEVVGKEGESLENITLNKLDEKK